VRKEDVERNIPGNPVEIPYVQVQEEWRRATQWNVTEIHHTANKELFLPHDNARRITKPSQYRVPHWTMKRSKCTTQQRQGMTKLLKWETSLVEKMLSTLKSFMHESICPNFEEIKWKFSRECRRHVANISAWHCYVS
jgi:hypothetical protein